MLHKDLNQNIFNTDIEQLPIRKGFGTGLLKAGEKDARVVALCADLTESTQMHLFKEKLSNRFIEVGVAEQNLASVASGMAAMGKIPFFSSYAMFSPGRNWEQIRTTLCYNNQKAIIVGSHAGISVGPDGGTHQAIEDIAITRVIPNMTVISPCDAIEAEKATLACIDDTVQTPVYLRLAREKTPIITTQETPFEIGKGYVCFGNTEKPIDVTVFATGALVYQSIQAAKETQDHNIVVINIHTIKPLDTALVLEYAQKSQYGIISVEEHQKAGGLGSAIAEYLAQHHPTKQLFIGVDDQFGQSGTPTELLEHYGLDSKTIKQAIQNLIR